MTPIDLKYTAELAGVERTTTHGLPSVRVRTSAASGLVYLQGAHVAEWAPAGQSGVLWMSPNAVYQAGKPLRGGIPICFPWFGPHPEHKDYPAHGFVRTREFEYAGARIDDAGRTELEFVLESDESSQALFPHAFQARLRVAFGATLGLEFSVANRGQEPFLFEEALHSYFAVADAPSATLLGLKGASYTDKVRGMAQFTEDSAALRLTGETDRVYASSATCTIHDAQAGRSIRIDKSNSQTTVIWNPWSARAGQMADFGADAWPHMLCVESANVAGARITLPPGDTHILRVAISVAPAPAPAPLPNGPA